MELCLYVCVIVTWRFRLAFRSTQTGGGLLEELIVEPSVDLLESLRSVGYSMEAALADILDNSIDARADHITIDMDIVEGAYVAILDNGEGMSPAKAEEALRLGGTAGGSRPDRLGRFGLGLKTASLSQARVLTVISRRDGKTTALQWDLDYVARVKSWKLLQLDEVEIQALPLSHQLINRAHGTLVIWSNLDLLLGDTNDPGAFLSEATHRLIGHLGLTFHRYLNRPTGKLVIELNGANIFGIDPFLSSNPKTQFTPQETLLVGEHAVRFQAFTLPHFSGLSPLERRRPDLGEGMRAEQGFYIYRNERLISKGHWFGLARVSELNKLTRIKVDVPRELDNLWQLDIKKSRTEPPASFKVHLKKMMDPILIKGRRVNSFRGRTDKSGEVSHVWDKVSDREGFRYEINLENPVVRATLAKLETNQAESVLALLHLVATHYPYLDLYNEIAGNVSPASPKIGDEFVLEKLKALRSAEILGPDVKSVFEILKTSEPFLEVENLQRLIERVWETADGIN